MLILINTTLKQDQYVLYKDGEYYLEMSKSNDTDKITAYLKAQGFEEVEII